MYFWRRQRGRRRREPLDAHPFEGPMSEGERDATVPLPLSHRTESVVAVAPNLPASEKE